MSRTAVALDHIANAVQPLLTVTSAPELFGPADLLDIIRGAHDRLDQARAALTTESPQ